MFFCLFKNIYPFCQALENYLNESRRYISSLSHFFFLENSQQSYLNNENVKIGGAGTAFVQFIIIAFRLQQLKQQMNFLITICQMNVITVFPYTLLQH